MRKFYSFMNCPHKFEPEHNARKTVVYKSSMKKLLVLQMPVCCHIAINKQYGPFSTQAAWTLHCCRTASERFPEVDAVINCCEFRINWAHIRRQGVLPQKGNQSCNNLRYERWIYCAINETRRKFLACYKLKPTMRARSWFRTRAS